MLPPTQHFLPLFILRSREGSIKFSPVTTSNLANKRPRNQRKCEGKTRFRESHGSGCYDLLRFTAGYFCLPLSRSVHFHPIHVLCIHACTYCKPWYFFLFSNIWFIRTLIIQILSRNNKIRGQNSD